MPCASRFSGEHVADDPQLERPSQMLATNRQASSRTLCLKRAEQLFHHPQSNRTGAVVACETAPEFGFTTQGCPVAARPCQCERFWKPSHCCARHGGLCENPQFVPRVRALQSARRCNGEVADTNNGLQETLAFELCVAGLANLRKQIVGTNAVARSKRTCIAKERAQNVNAMGIPVAGECVRISGNLRPLRACLHSALAGVAGIRCVDACANIPRARLSMSIVGHLSIPIAESNRRGSNVPMQDDREGLSREPAKIPRDRIVMCVDESGYRRSTSMVPRNDARTSRSAENRSRHASKDGRSKVSDAHDSLASHSMAR